MGDTPMTSPLSPEAVAQMVADREAGTPGPWVSTSANEVWRDGFGSPDLSVFDRIAVVEPTYSTKMGVRHCTGSVDANARRIARLPDLEAAYLTLAAENATLLQKADRSHAQAERATLLFMEAVNQVNSLRASEAAAMERVKVLELALRYCGVSDETPGGIIRCAAKAALTPTADKEPKT